MRRSLRLAKNNILNYTEAECLVREVTSNDAWINEEAKEEIYKRFNEYHDAFLMKQILWKRLTDYPHISHVAKSLALIEYVLEREKSDGINNLTNDVIEKYELIEKLKKYRYYRQDVEMGNVVRMSAENICEFIVAEMKIVNKRRASVPEVMKAAEVKDLKSPDTRRSSLPDINAVLRQYDENPVIDNDFDVEAEEEEDVMVGDEDFKEVNEQSPPVEEVVAVAAIIEEVKVEEPQVVVVEEEVSMSSPIPLTKAQTIALQYDEIQAVHDEKMKNMPQASINDDVMLMTGLRPVKPIYNNNE